MTWQVVIMLLVSGVFTLVGVGLLLSLLRPSGPGKIYAFRMVGIMALALGIALAVSAGAMWRWSLEG